MTFWRKEMIFSRVPTHYSRPASRPIVRVKLLKKTAGEPGCRKSGQRTISSCSETQMPFITVAIPTYRRLPMLRRAVESVFAQTFTDWEMVVSDDETPPGETWNFLERLARSDPRVKPVMNSSPHGH